MKQLDGRWHLILYLSKLWSEPRQSSLQQQQQNSCMEAKHMALEPLGRKNTLQDECRDAANKADFNMSN